MDIELTNETPDAGADFDYGAAMDEVAAELLPRLHTEDKGAPTPQVGETTTPPKDESKSADPGEAKSTPPAGTTTAPPTPYPKSWKPALQAKWDSLDPEVRTEVLRREDDFHRGTAPLRQAQQFVQRFQQASEPVADLLRAGVDPVELYGNFAKAHATLSKGGPEAVAFLRSLAQDYKLDLNAEQAYVDPNLAALQQRVDGLHSQLSTQQEQQLQARRTEVAQQINSFAADPKNEFFNDVAQDMVNLLKADARLTLDKAYEMAVWVNPTVRDKLLAKQSDAKKAEAAAAEAARAAQAAAASQGSVRNTPRSAPATGAAGSVDDTMKETLAAIRARG